MSDRDKSFSGSKFGKGSNIGFSGLKSKQLVQSHLKSIMPSLRGGKNESDIKYLRIRVQENLEFEKNLRKQLEPILNQFCGEYYDYKVFKGTDEILEEEITEQDLFYIFVKDQHASWGERFSRQEIQQSEGKKSICIVEFLTRHKYEQKVQQRAKLIAKNRRDPNEKIIYYINSNGKYMQDMQQGLINDMDAKLKNKLLREGDRAKTLALANKFKQKKSKRQRLFIYIETRIAEKISTLYRRFRKRNGFKWTQIIQFSSFQDLIKSIKKREVELTEESNLVSAISINPVSKIFDRSQSAIKTMSIIGGGQSALASSKSVKNLIQQKMEPRLRNFDKNFIIHSYDFEDGEKIYQFVMSQKDNNWQSVIYQDKNFPQMDQLVKQIQQNQKQGENDQYLKIINAQTLYIVTYAGDVETDAISSTLTNTFNNRYLLGYNNEDELLTLLNQYSRNDDNFTIVIINYQGSSEDNQVGNFIQKNQLSDQNILILYKKANDLNESLSMNSKLSINDEKDVDKYLRAIMEDRDRSFNPFDCYADNYVYLIYRYDKQNLLDDDLRRKIAESARLKKATYQDANYLETFLKSIQRGGDHAIVLTEDNNLREAQEVVKKFNKASIMNVTDRKRVKDEIKVLAWGPYASIKNAIFSISQKAKVTERKKYNQVGNQFYMQNPQPRRMPKTIPFREGNNITVKISSLETDPNSEIMQQNLNYYFKQEIRIENYQKPNEIRLVNKLEQPLTFIICRDDEEELNYMKSIAKEEKDDLRQEYILFSKNPKNYVDPLFKKYERFRFISNSWQRIEQYIIGLYQNIRGIKNQENDSILEDELIHVFYHHEDTHLLNAFQNGFKNSAVYPAVRFHDIRHLQWIALEQSPHHLYYILADEISGKLFPSVALKQIQRVQSELERRKVAPKRMKMLTISKKTGAMRDRYIQGTFEEAQQALNYIANTKIEKAKYDVLKPYILIDRSSQDWYYFLNKHSDKGRYFFYYIDNVEDAAKLITTIRSNDVAAQFWYLANNQKDLVRFLEISNNIEQGNRIYGIYHGVVPTGIPVNKIIFANSAREEIEAFILNAHKRSNIVFSPENLRKKNPILAMSKANKQRIPIDPTEIKKWKQDLGAQQFYYENPAELKNIPSDRAILITDIQEDRNLPNLWKIIFDSNQAERKKAHYLTKIHANPRETFYGFYPAQITNYLRFLRYNIKNSPEKLKGLYSSELTNIYMEKDLTLNPSELETLLKTNYSIANVWQFQNTRAFLQNSINHSLMYPNYNNLFIMSSAMENVLNEIPQRPNINYIVYNQKFRNLEAKASKSQLLTDESKEYVTYIFNLPERRFEKAKNNRDSNPLKLMYMNNGKLDPQIRELKQINKRNSNFLLVPYESINDLAQIRDKIIVLAHSSSYDAHLTQLKPKDNITYFVLGEDKNRNLIADPSKSQYFVSKQNEELLGYFNNLRKGSNLTSLIKFPAFNEPEMVRNSQNFKFSRPLAFKSGLDLSKVRILPEFQKQNNPRKAPPSQPRFNLNYTNLIDAPRKQIFFASPNLNPDSPITPLNLEKFLPSGPSQSPVPIPTPNPIPTPSPKPLTLSLDYPPGVVEDKFNSRADDIDSIPKQISKPSAKAIERKLAIVHPDNKEFKEILRVLQSNLYPKSFSRVQSFPYSSDYDFESLARNQSKFLGFDRTVLFLVPRMHRYTEQLKQIQGKMKGKLQYYFFNDNFHRHYDGFKNFLNPYIINSQQIPYINREDPRFWLRTNNYNVMVPLNKKKKYNSMKGQHISVLPYTSPEDIENQLHRSEEFVIIVCEKKDYNDLKHFTKRSPRCIIVIQDTQQLKEDQVPLMRYPKKVLYYGPDALNYLSKIRIPSKNGPFFPETMKVLFFNQKHSNEEEYVYQQEFDEYEKVPYINAEDLFIKLIEKFKSSSNFKVPHSLVAKDLIKLHPKIFIQKKTLYMSKYLNEHSAISPHHEKQFKRSFSSLIKPEQYLHLPILQYENIKDLKQFLEREEGPCLVFLDQNNRQHLGIMKQFSHKHLFIQMFDLFDIWIDRNGFLIPSHELSREELATKQALFTQMFSTEVFQAYNDMGYYYLSNSYKEVKKEVRKITFMTKEELFREFNRQPNLLMVIFVEHTDRKWIPTQFYDPERDESKEPRVKLIFIHHAYVHNENILYIKYNEIDPVILHINRVELSSRTDYCLYPANRAGKFNWHRFLESHQGYQSKQYTNMGDIDSIAQEIKGKFRKVCVICQKDEQDFIKNVFAQYSIKTKEKTGEEVFFWGISDSDNRSYMIPFSSIKKSNINLNEHSEDNEEKFETAGHQVDIKVNSSNAHYNSNIKESSPGNLEDVVESKNFIINLSENLKDTFPVGNLYTNGVKHFKNLKSVDMNSPLNQLIVTNQNLNEVKTWVQNNPKLFLIYVSDEIPAGKDGNALIIKEEEVPKFINKLEGIQRAGKKNDPAGSNNNNFIMNQNSHSSNTSNYNSPNYNSNSNNTSTNPNIENDWKVGGKNLQDFRVVKIFYDEHLDKDLKKQILLAAIKNKNFRPYLFKDLDTLKKLMKEEGSLSLLLISKDPPNLKQELEKQNYTIIKNKRGKKLIVPKYFNSGIDGLSTILEQEQSQFENLNKQSLDDHVDHYLRIMEKNPEKGRKNLLIVQEEHENQNLPENDEILELQQQESDKLNLHSNINIEGNEAGGREWIKQRLDGGVIVLFVDKARIEKVIDLKKKYNVLLQEYSHSINLNNSIREKKDKFTIVLVDPNMLSEVRSIKEQHPKTVFILVNNENKQISPKDRANISFQIANTQEIQPIIVEICEQNEKIKYNDHAKINSKMDNKKTSYVDNGNSWRLSTGYQNTRVKNAFIFYKQEQNKDLIKKIKNLNHITFVPYKDVNDAQKKFNSYSGYQVVLIANDQDIPQFEDYIMKKKEQTYIIKLNPPEDHRENPKIRKNILLSAYSDKQVVDFLLIQFGEHAQNQPSQQMPKQGKSYAPRYQPNAFGTTPRFPSQKDYVPYKNDPIYSSRGIKSLSRDSKVLRTDPSSRDISSKNTLSPYYNRS